MSRTTRARNAIGALAVAASWLLASPGVQVARAQPAVAELEGPACDAAAERRTSKDTQLAALLERLRARGDRATAPDGNRIVVLNNRGHNSEAPRPIELDAVLREADAGR